MDQVLEKTKKVLEEFGSKARKLPEGYGLLNRIAQSNKENPRPSTAQSTAEIN